MFSKSYFITWICVQVMKVWAYLIIVLSNILNTLRRIDDVMLYPRGSIATKYGECFLVVLMMIGIKYPLYEYRKPQ